MPWKRPQPVRQPAPPPSPALPENGAGPHDEEEVRGIFEPPNSFVLTALARHKAMIAVFAIAFAVAGIAFGALRQPTYTASATLQVGEVNPNSPGFLGYVQSASSLATAFSRAIAAVPVLAAVEKDVGLSRPQATARLSAEPIPLSPAFRIIATGPSADGAMRLSNSAAKAVVDYESHRNSANPQVADLLDEYRQSSLELRQALAKTGGLEGSSEDPGPLLRAQADTSAAKVRQRAVENAYIAAVTSQAPRQGLVFLLAGATSASSDRKAKIQLYALLGLLGGAVIGGAAAVMRERRISKTALPAT
jgi:uncharacterized protein involved in exopolysaccharide biosynthesis